LWWRPAWDPRPNLLFSGYRMYIGRDIKLTSQLTLGLHGSIPLLSPLQRRHVGEYLSTGTNLLLPLHCFFMQPFSFYCLLHYLFFIFLRICHSFPFCLNFFNSVLFTLPVPCFLDVHYSPFLYFWLSLILTWQDLVGLLQLVFHKILIEKSKPLILIQEEYDDKEWFWWCYWWLWWQSIRYEAKARPKYKSRTNESNQGWGAPLARK
jgi:hypothetical protein